MSSVKPDQNKIAVYILILGIVLILIMTLFPYDFFFLEILSQLTLKELIELLTKSSSKSDIIQNLLLFIPFGFGLFACLNARNINDKKPLFLVAIASFIFSFIVEFLQFFLPGRTSTPIDLLTNTLSGVSGGLIYQYWGQLIFNQFNRFLNQIKRSISIPSLTLFFLFYFTVSLLLSLPLQNTSYLWGLQNWNADFPLILSNELTGDRPWNGEIEQFCLMNRVASKNDVDQVFGSKNPCHSFSTQQGIIFKKNQIPIDPISITQLNQKTSQTSELTLAIQLSTADTNQIGPARILSISKDLFKRNFTLGQWRSHLSIRMRNTVTGKNGTRPEFIIPNIFSDLKTHTILLTYRPDEIQIYLDKLTQAYQLSLTPEMALFWQLSPIPQGSIHLNSFNSIFYKVLYYCLIFYPLGVCLGLIVTQMRGTVLFHILFVTMGIIFPIILFEALLSFKAARTISWSNQWLSISIMLIACYLNYRVDKNRIKV